MNWNYIADYIRMISFGIIILCSLKGIFATGELQRRFSNLLFWGDIIICLGLLTAGVSVTFFHIPRETMTDELVTPVAVLWATIHFVEILKG